MGRPAGSKEFLADAAGALLASDAERNLPVAEVRGLARHPLVYAKRVARVEPRARAGDLVAVHQKDGVCLGYAFFNPRSEIRLRMVRRGPTPPDPAWWRTLLADAVRLRRDTLRLDESTNAYRVMHAEADGFPGLVVDRYDDVLVAEAFSLGFHQRAPELLAMLCELTGAPHWVLRPGPAMVAQEGCAADVLTSPTAPEAVTITEFGTRFRVPVTSGHKTGFFCDQRDNRRRLAELCRDRTVLDVCCYTGGFAVQAKHLGKAADVVAVDLDEEPLNLARTNANLNQARIHFARADAFIHMRDLQRANRQFDIVVLDPPKFIRNRGEYEEGKKKHFDLNRLALRLVRPGGLLLTCSCAGLLAEEEFLFMIDAAARRAGEASEDGNATAGRSLRILSVTGAAADHPVAPECPESRYLKAVWAQVN